MEEFRLTSQRKLILEVLMNRQDHPPADQIYLKVREKIPNISLGTVYRNLEIMTVQGMINKIETPDGQKRFDYDSSTHPHFRCVKCGRIEDIPLDLVPPVPDPEDPWVKSRLIRSTALSYTGLCEDCVPGA